MTIHAPWLALSTDWRDSDMLQGASAEVRLAWLELLCHAKAQGRGGVVRVQRASFCRTYQLSREAVDEMLERGENDGALEIDGNTVTVTNWRSYQQKATKAGSRVKNAEKSRSPETRQKSANQAPSTKHTSPSTETNTPLPPEVETTAEPDDEAPVTGAERHGAIGEWKPAWQELPRNCRQNPKGFQDAWCRARRSGVPPDELAKALREYYASPAGTGQYRRLPHNFLDQQGWLEDAAAWESREKSESDERERKRQAQLKRVCG